MTESFEPKNSSDEENPVIETEVVEHETGGIKVGAEFSNSEDASNYAEEQGINPDAVIKRFTKETPVELLMNEEETRPE